MTTAPKQTDGVDIAIGVVTTGASPSVPTVVKVVQEGMLTHLGGLTAAIIHMDPTMPDEQAGQVEPVADGIRLIHARPAGAMATASGLDGWSESVRAVLGLSRTLHARAVVLLNADITSMTPEWIRGLAAPVLKGGCAFVLPIYERGRYEGTLTQLFVAPLARALFGHQFWHPMADEFGCTGETAEFLLGQDIWTTDIARQGLEFWLPIGVAGGALPVAQSVLGPRVLNPTGPQLPLGSTVGRVAGALFSTAERHEAGWLDVRGSSRASSRACVTSCPFGSEFFPRKRWAMSSS